MPLDGSSLHRRQTTSSEAVRRRLGTDVVPDPVSIPSTKHHHGGADKAHRVPPRPLGEHKKLNNTPTVLQQMLQNIYLALITTVKVSLSQCHLPWHCTICKPLHNSKIKKLFRTLISATTQADVILEESRSSRPHAPPPKTTKNKPVANAPQLCAHGSTSVAHPLPSVGHASYAHAPAGEIGRE